MRSGAQRDRPASLRRPRRGTALIAATALAWAGFALAASPAAASDAAPANPARPAAAAADVHPIDPRRSSASFLVTVRLRRPAEGRFPGVTGEVRGSAAAGWRVQVRLDAQGLRLIGPRWMERVTRSPDFLAVDRFPSIRFESDAFDDAHLRAGGPLRGQLTLRGQRRPVVFVLLPSACARPGLDCDIRVQGGVSRHAFGMLAYQAMVQDRVEMQIRVRLRGGAP